MKTNLIAQKQKIFILCVNAISIIPVLYCSVVFVEMMESKFPNYYRANWFRHPWWNSISSQWIFVISLSGILGYIVHRQIISSKLSKGSFFKNLTFSFLAGTIISVLIGFIDISSMMLEGIFVKGESIAKFFIFIVPSFILYLPIALFQIWPAILILGLWFFGLNYLLVKPAHEFWGHNT